MEPEEWSTRSIGARVFVPTRARWCDALRVGARVVEDVTKGTVFPDEVIRVGFPKDRARRVAEETWESLATDGVIPQAWVGDPGRVFGAGERRGVSEAPAELAMALALAADVPGVLRAEQLAREVMNRLGPWCAWRPWSVLWRLVDPLRWTAPHGTQAGVFQRLAQGATVALHRAGDPHRGIASGHLRTLKRSRHGAAAFWDLHRASLWQYTSKRGLRLPALHVVPEGLQGSYFHEVPDPFEPLVHLWSTGYALERISAEHLVLIAPRPDA